MKHVLDVGCRIINFMLSHFPLPAIIVTVVARIPQLPGLPRLLSSIVGTTQNSKASISFATFNHGTDACQW
jgi:hypothetical protein